MSPPATRPPRATASIAPSSSGSLDQGKWVEGLGFGVEGSGFRVQDLGIKCSGFYLLRVRCIFPAAVVWIRGRLWMQGRSLGFRV